MRGGNQALLSLGQGQVYVYGLTKPKNLPKNEIGGQKLFLLCFFASIQFHGRKGDILCESHCPFTFPASLCYRGDTMVWILTPNRNCHGIYTLLPTNCTGGKKVLLGKTINITHLPTISAKQTFR